MFIWLNISASLKIQTNSPNHIITCHPSNFKWEIAFNVAPTLYTHIRCEYKRILLNCYPVRKLLFIQMQTLRIQNYHNKIGKLKIDPTICWKLAIDCIWAGYFHWKFLLSWCVCVCVRFAFLSIEAWHSFCFRQLPTESFMVQLACQSIFESLTSKKCTQTKYP